MTDRPRQSPLMPFPRWVWIIAILALPVAASLDAAAWRIGELLNEPMDRDYLFRIAGYAPTWLMILGVIILLGSGSDRPRVHLDRAMLIAGGIGVTAIAAALLKLLVRRLRPPAQDVEGFVWFAHRSFSERSFDGGGLAFPSEHVAVAFAGALLLTRFYPRGWPIWLLWAGGCAWARVSTRAHYLSDVTGAAILALVMTTLFILFVGRHSRHAYACLVHDKDRHAHIRDWPTRCPVCRCRFDPLRIADTSDFDKKDTNAGVTSPVIYVSNSRMISNVSSELTADTRAHTGPILSIIIPAFNEEDNVEPLIHEIRDRVWTEIQELEVVIVDDGSNDRTPKRLDELMQQFTFLRVIHHKILQGQSAAIRSGIEAARGQLIGILDADLQDDPEDLVMMARRILNGKADLIQGDRGATRQETVIGKFASRIGRWVRWMALGDAVRDTGCSCRVIRAEYARRLPLQFKGMHRFIPVFCHMLGARIEQMPVKHRERHAGTSKCGLGIARRGCSAFQDLLVMRWMIKRYKSPVMSIPNAAEFNTLTRAIAERTGRSVDEVIKEAQK